VQPPRAELQPYVRHPKYLGEVRRAGLVVEQVIARAAASDAAGAPRAREPRTLGGPTAARRGTNFSVPPTAAALLERLVGGV
jgi:hypothetical protein